jgi:hypothetical protein
MTDRNRRTKKITLFFSEGNSKLLVKVGTYLSNYRVIHHIKTVKFIRESISVLFI